jgi:hypothetical protein
MTGAAIGGRLRRRGLRPELAIAAFGGRTAVHAARLAAERRRSPPTTVAAAVIELFVGAGSVERELAERALGPDLETLAGLGLLEVGDAVTAAAALLPVGPALLACRRDALPDDSSFHLVGALSGPAPASWLDVGTGCGFAPLLCPAAGPVVATDVDRHAVDLARIGAALSGRGDVELAAADLLAAAAGRRFARVTFNAPIEGAAALLERFWSRVGDHLEPAGEVIVHSIDGPLPSLPGEVIAVRYTPADHRPGFAVSRWRPDAGPRRRRVAIELDPETPHVTRAAFG